MQLTKKAFLDFVKKNKDHDEYLSRSTVYYARIFDKYVEGNQSKFFASWNWAPALLGGAWMFYRGMYKWGFLYYLAALLFGCATVWIVGWDIGFHNFFPVFFAWGILGNTIYVAHVREKLAQNEKRGGTHPWGAVLYLFVLQLIEMPIVGGTYVVSHYGLHHIGAYQRIITTDFMHQHSFGPKLTKLMGNNPSNLNVLVDDTHIHINQNGIKIHGTDQGKPFSMVMNVRHGSDKSGHESTSINSGHIVPHQEAQKGPDRAGHVQETSAHTDASV